MVMNGKHGFYVNDVVTKFAEIVVISIVNPA